MFLFLKALISACFIVLITFIAKKTSFLGGLIAMMPVNIVLSLLWLHFEKTDTTQLSNFVRAAIFGILPTGIFLVVVLSILNKSQKFEYSLLAGVFALLIFAVIQYKILKAI